jgi:hypothetical protein
LAAVAFDPREMQRWLRSRGVPEACPACRKTGDPHMSLVAPARLDDGEIPIPNELLPMAAVVCGNCAHIRFFSLKHLGI